jgi:hypothetical protein
MAKEATPEGKLRRWVEGVLSQAADDDVAATTLAVLWNADGLADGPAAARAPLAALLHQPFADLGSADPQLDASLAAHCVVGALSDFLWRRSRPSRAETQHVVAFCLGAVRP